MLYHSSRPPHFSVSSVLKTYDGRRKVLTQRTQSKDEDAEKSEHKLKCWLRAIRTTFVKRSALPHVLRIIHQVW